MVIYTAPSSKDNLAVFATRARAGRHVNEPACNMRSPFQRDRDRILHSTPFRRLMHKTQVFVTDASDHFRTRLTHTLEVAQIARTLARNLKVDEDLCEALALAHDLGHTPFGHAGERVLNKKMADHGGFEHNAQSFRIVTLLEKRYAGFDGLNLCFETLEGIAKHNGPIVPNKPLRQKETSKDHAISRASKLDYALRDYAAPEKLHLSRWPGIEAQLAAICDDIAYNSHDIDDGLRSGCITMDEIRNLALTAPIFAQIERDYGALELRRMNHELCRRLVNLLAIDVLTETQRNIAELASPDPEAIANSSHAIAEFSRSIQEGIDELRAFLAARLYNHPSLADARMGAANILADMFDLFASSDYIKGREADPDPLSSRRDICDYIAGMTDRYALETHKHYAK